MKPEDIKVGETYYVRVKADRYEVDGAYFQLIDENGHGDKGHRFYSCCYYAFLPTPTPPKYDPRRRFKKGDEVRVVEWHGRQSLRAGRVGFVVKNEDASGMVELSIDGWKNGIFYHACYLELVTPVEELEPYSVHESEVIQGFDIVRDKLCVMTFPFGAKECGWYYNRLAAKEAAEAERDRLNAEYRKDQNND